MKNKIFVAAFALLLAVICILNIALPKKEFSDNENRYLAVFPEASFDSVKSGEFMSKLSEYLADHFVLRDGWVTLKSLAESALLKTENNGVFRGKDGYLIDSFDEKSAAGFDDNLASVAEFTQTAAQNYGIDVKTVIAPTATQILSDKLPAFAVTADGNALLDKAAAVPGVVDVRAALAEHRDEYIYYRTDHHWTALGAYYAYAAYRAAFGASAAPYEAFQVEIAAEPFFGTTYSRFGRFFGVRGDVVSAPAYDAAKHAALTNSKGETHDSIYFPESVSGKDKYLYFLGGNDSRMTVKTPTKNGKTLLLIKDSYANSFLPYLCGDYETIILLDLRYYLSTVSSLIESENVTDILILYNLKSFSEDKNIRFINSTS